MAWSDLWFSWQDTWGHLRLDFEVDQKSSKYRVKKKVHIWFRNYEISQIEKPDQENKSMNV